MTTGDLTIQRTLQFNSGTLGITGASGLTVGAAGPFGSSRPIGGGQSLEVPDTLPVDSGVTLTLTPGGNISASTLANSDIAQGSGYLSATLANQAGGLVHVQLGDLLTFVDTSNSNDGDI